MSCVALQGMCVGAAFCWVVFYMHCKGVSALKEDVDCQTALLHVTKSNHHGIKNPEIDVNCLSYKAEGVTSLV